MTSRHTVFPEFQKVSIYPGSACDWSAHRIPLQCWSDYPRGILATGHTVDTGHQRRHDTMQTTTIVWPEQSQQLTTHFYLLQWMDSMNVVPSSGQHKLSIDLLVPTKSSQSFLNPLILSSKIHFYLSVSVKFVN